jgi:hypothetical protein
MPGEKMRSFFKECMNALLEGGHESEMIGRLDEARVWPAKWHEPDPQALEWATR